MNRRSIFKTIAGLLAAPFAPLVKPKKVASASELDRWFVEDSAKILASVEAVMRKQGRVSALLKKEPFKPITLPSRMGDTKRSVS